MPDTTPSQTALLQQLTALTDLPGVAEVAERAREAGTRLRFHEALRRRIPEAAAESRVRGARASAALDGADLPVELVRELMSGARPWPDELDAGIATLKGAVAATAETERVVALVRTAPLQALARLHVAAGAPLAGHVAGAEAGPLAGGGPGVGSALGSADTLGRPRVGDETSDEFVDLGPAPAPTIVSSRLAGLSELVLAGASAANRVPAAVISSIVHAEIVSIRPFVHGNGLVARAMERVLVQALGLDPTGVSVPEAGHVANGGPAYLGALTAYGTGTASGVGLWLTQAGEALVRGVAEGERISDAVRAGRLG
ncbi:hypothetical protein FHX52_4510 [Humibacillus xanthopallidus]|uniref:Fido domain-containing protein n=1 Tax=Humibacillus xanthopallidus TaxID=412689 RepID=A0A543PMG8_9MICO|nr:hypothetical protein [Humibacillus xanthopallidus]TQN45271.1 hypothetical protein FHX52_4510 [Humibacillus xanthopallidus]